jgi:hypothetical protein
MVGEAPRSDRPSVVAGQGPADHGVADHRFVVGIDLYG